MHKIYIFAFGSAFGADFLKTKTVVDQKNRHSSGGYGK